MLEKVFVIAVARECNAASNSARHTCAENSERQLHSSGDQVCAVNFSLKETARKQQAGPA